MPLGMPATGFRRFKIQIPINSQCVQVMFQAFFLAHAVHARGSDGHQNVLSLINCSHIVREQVKSKKPGVFQVETKQTQPQTQPKTTTTKKTPRKLGETLRFQKRKSSCGSVLHDDMAIPANRCPKWLQVVESGCPASFQLLNKGGELVDPRPRRWSCARQEKMKEITRFCLQPEKGQ